MPSLPPGLRYSRNTINEINGVVGDRGRSNVVTPNDKIVTFPDDKVTATATVAICASPCLLTKIECQSATGSVTITLYDNIASAAGNIIYTGAFSTGDFVVIDQGDRTPKSVVPCFQGLYLSFTGTATFDIYMAALPA